MTNRIIMGKRVEAAFFYPSKSNPDRCYETLKYVDGSFSCNCRGWIFNRKCWHITDAANQLRAADTVTFASTTEVRPRSVQKAVDRISKQQDTPFAVVFRRQFNFEEN